MDYLSQGVFSPWSLCISLISIYSLRAIVDRSLTIWDRSKTVVKGCYMRSQLQKRLLRIPRNTVTWSPLATFDSYMKGTVARDFFEVFFPQTVPPGPIKNFLKPFGILENSWSYLSFKTTPQRPGLRQWTKIICIVDFALKAVVVG